MHAKVAVQGKDAVARARNYLQQFRELYRQNNTDLALAVRRVNSLPDEHVLFYQTYKGIEVFAGELLVSLHRNEVF